MRMLGPCVKAFACRFEGLLALPYQGHSVKMLLMVLWLLLLYHSSPHDTLLHTLPGETLFSPKSINKD